MLALTHLVLAVVLIRWFNLDRNAAFATLLFGVFIDLDHIFGIIDFVARDPGNALNLDAALSSDIQWKSLAHSPVGILFVAPVALAANTVIPILAWGLHLVMDYVQIYYLGIASPVEMLLLTLLVIGLLYIERMEYQAATGDPSFRGLLKWEADRAAAMASALPLVRSIRRRKGPRGTVS